MKDPETIQDTYNLNEIHVIKNDGIKEKAIVAVKKEIDYIFHFDCFVNG